MGKEENVFCLWRGSSDEVHEASLLLRAGMLDSVDDLRCRFMARLDTDVEEMEFRLKRLTGDRRELEENDDGMVLVVEERGRVDDEASFGSVGAARREVLKVPEARFLVLDS